MAEIPAGKQEITCLEPLCELNEKWYKVTTHEVAIMVKIKKNDMKKHGKYQCTNKVNEDLVGWVTIWKKLDQDASKKEEKWKGKEIMVLVDPSQENENILDYNAEAALSQRTAQESGCVPKKMVRWDTWAENDMKQWEEEYESTGIFRIGRKSQGGENRIMAKTMQEILEGNTAE